MLEKDIIFFKLKSSIDQTEMKEKALILVYRVLKFLNTDDRKKL